MANTSTHEPRSGASNAPIREDIGERNDRKPDGSLANPSSLPPTPVHGHQDGTEGMTESEQRSAGIVDDAGRKIVPGQAFLLVAALFMAVAVLSVLVWLIYNYTQAPVH